MSNWSGISDFVAADIAEHGLDKVFDAIMQAAVAAEEPQNSDALAYLAAQINTVEIRATSNKMAPIFAGFRRKVSKLDEVYKKFVESATKLDYKALDFTDHLEDKASPMNMRVRTSFVLRQPVVRVIESFAGFMSMEDLGSAQYKFEKFITSSLPALIREQIDLYEYFTRYESRYNSEEENRKYSTYTRLRPIPGQLHKIVSMGELYRLAREQLNVIIENMGAFEAAVTAQEEAAKQYNVAKAEIQKLIYDEIGNYVDCYYEISQSLKTKS